MLLRSMRSSPAKSSIRSGAPTGLSRSLAEHEEISAGTAEHAIATGTAREHVVTGTAIEHVVARGAK